MEQAAILLSELAPGGSAVVIGVEAPAALRERLEALGFVPETEVRCRRRAPLGDPRLYELRGTQICLRRSEAARVRIRVQPR